jgi:flagellar motility protein MotE (MotC chaperone)
LFLCFHFGMSCYNEAMSTTTATTISEYNDIQSDEDKKICSILQKEINKELKEATSKVWHGGPVWFLDNNPVAGYWVRKHGGVQLLFWSGQSFDEPGLAPEGTFKAAQKNFLNTSEIDSGELNGWLKKAREIQWDYKNLVKRKGDLERLR